MQTVSLDTLRDREHQLLDHEYDSTEGLHPATTVDRYMELNDARMGQDSEEARVRQNRTDRMLRERPIPYYQPF